MDLATIIGLVLGFGAVFGGAILEGLHLTALIQPTAALIVLGGTFGAVFVSFPLPACVQAFKDVKSPSCHPKWILNRLSKISSAMPPSAPQRPDLP